MKKIFLKKGVWFMCKLSTTVDGRNRPVRHISVFEDVNTSKKMKNAKSLYTVSDGMGYYKVSLGEGVKELDSYHILSAAEIIDNFGFFWDNLNQK